MESISDDDTTGIYIQSKIHLINELITNLLIEADSM